MVKYADSGEAMWMPPLKTDSGNITAQQAVLQIKIVLLGTKPPIWRRVLVPAEFTLAELHDVIQAVMEWENSHLHAFRIGRQSFGAPSMSGPSMNEKKVCLANVMNKASSKATYIYDFGDSWEHAITVEKILPAEPNVAYPLCTGGKLAGPPEDCGGIPGFYHMLEAIADPSHEDHEDMRDWIESFDPEEFSVQTANQRLCKIFRAPRKSKRAPVVKSEAAMPRPSQEDLHAALQAIETVLERPLRKQRQRIRPDEKVPLELSDRERELILEHAFAADDLIGRLRVASTSGQHAVFHFSLDDLDDLAGCVAAEANHAKDKKLRKEWDRIFARISDLLDSYTDQDD